MIMIESQLERWLKDKGESPYVEDKDVLLPSSIENFQLYPTHGIQQNKEEILEFNNELGSNLPFISENGAAINGLNLLNSDLPKELILSREKDNLLNMFKNIVPINLQNKCMWASSMEKKKQSLIFGLDDKKLNLALNRKYTIPFIFNGTKTEKNKLSKIIRKEGLFLQEGGRVINLTDRVNKAKALQVFVRFYKKYQKHQFFAHGEI